jgi:phospholipase C
LILKGILSMIFVIGLGLVAAGGVQSETSVLVPDTETPIKHLVVLMQNNHTFDNYFGAYPGADGIPAGTCMPLNPHLPDDPSCVKPYHIGNRPIEDLEHSLNTFNEQYNLGLMNGFVYALNRQNQDGTISMGYYDDRDIPYYWNIADEYVLFDRFFSSAHTGSVSNRMFWVAAVPGNDKNQIPEQGYGDIVTIFDRLQEQGISWKFYINNYDSQLTYRNLRDGGLLSPQVQWAPLLGFDRFIDDPELNSRIVDMDEYFTDIENGTLPAVSYVLALGATEHPLSSLELGQRFTRNMLQALMASELWDKSAFLITYDDWGGWFDHVPPPQIDRYGYGFRVPALLVSPYAKRGYIDSTTLDYTSIPSSSRKLGLEPLAEQTLRQTTSSMPSILTNPREPRFISWERTPAQHQQHLTGQSSMLPIQARCLLPGY